MSAPPAPTVGDTVTCDGTLWIVTDLVPILGIRHTAFLTPHDQPGSSYIIRETHQLTLNP